MSIVLGPWGPGDRRPKLWGKGLDCCHQGSTLKFGLMLQMKPNVSSMEKKMASHSIILAWGIPWTEDPAGLQFMGSQRVRHSLAAEYTHAISSVVMKG